MNILKLKNYAADLRGWDKITDALFVENLVSEIEKRSNITVNVVERWLKSAFSDLPTNPDKDNCIDTYNRMFYYSILEKLS